LEAFVLAEMSTIFLTGSTGNILMKLVCFKIFIFEQSYLAECFSVDHPKVFKYEAAKRVVRMFFKTPL
jgi:hypothetical protein